MYTIIKTTKNIKTFKTKQIVYIDKPGFVKCISHFKGVVAEFLEVTTVYMHLSDFDGFFV